MNERAGFLAALQEGGVAERRITRRIFADWLEDRGEPTEAARQRILGEEPYRNTLGMEFAHLPPGTFWMGGQDGICGTQQVTIEHDFYIGVYPVTQAKWTEVMGSNPSWFQRASGGAAIISGLSDAELSSFPVESVSWNDCRGFLNELNSTCNESGWVYRLPTEEEWEYACRAGATSQADYGWNFYFLEYTNSLTPQRANFAESGLQRPTVVGIYAPSPLGIYDLHGNIREICENLYGSDSSDRVSRGGSWYDTARDCRAAFRERYHPVERNFRLGLRLVRVPVG